MSDLEDVSAALASTITGIINANGAPAPISVVTGWPTPDDLTAATAAGKVIVSVYPRAGQASNVTRWQWDWQVLTPASLTITAVLTATTVTFGGTITLPLNVAVVATDRVYTYSVQSTDTLTTIAAALAALISAKLPATSSGPVLTIPSGPVDLKCTLGGQGTLIRENARSKQAYQITVWAPTQPLRKATVAAFEAGLYALDYISLPDGTAGMLLFMLDLNIDAGQVDNFYRRDIVCTVEYGITQTAPAWAIVTAQVPVTTVPMTQAPLNPIPKIT